MKLLTFVFVEVRVTFPPVRFPGRELRTLNRMFSLTTQSMIPLNLEKMRGRSDVKNVLFFVKRRTKIFASGKSEFPFQLL